MPRTWLKQLALVAAAALLAAPAPAQTMIFDGFEGPDFHPRWNTPGPSGGVWTYDFENSMFNLRSVTPSVPGKIPWRREALSTSVELAGDFRVVARIGWGEDQLVRSIMLQLLGGPPVGATLYTVGFAQGGGLPEPSYSWQLSPPGFGMRPAPRSGFADVEVRRAGNMVVARIDGVEVAKRTDLVVSIHTLRLDIVGDSRGMAPLHIDSILVVPAPSVGMAPLTLAALAAVRRRRPARRA